MSKLVLNRMLGIDISEHRLKLDEVLGFRSFCDLNNFVEIDGVIVFLALFKAVLNFSEFFVEAVLVRSWNFHDNRSALFQQFQSLVVISNSFSDSS